MASVSDSTSRSNSAADSYVGSLISLTSKSEIRYEGVLYNINTEESSIGLINVRSFGTEGRKKDGQQIPPGDKVYEYILFRGSDIKDLQVKSSPPVQPTPPINNDPAIIQSHYSRPVTTSSTLPSSVSVSLTDVNSHSTQLGLPGSNFQGALPLYQPGGSIGSWGAPPPAPGANGSGLAMPLYWQGYYGAPNGLPNLHQQSLLRPPPGLSMPSSMQQQMQYPNFNPSLPTGLSNLPEFPSSLITSSSSPSEVSISFPSTNLPSTLPPAPSASLSSETLPASVANKVPTVSLPAGTLSGNLPSQSPLATSSPDINSAVPPISNKPNAISVSSLPYQSLSQPTPAVVGSSNASHTEALALPLVTPGQILQSGSSIGHSSQPLPTSHKDVEVVQMLSTSLPEPSVPVSSQAQPPILPLPGVSRPNGAPVQTHHGYGSYRGRGRGRGAVSSHSVTEFTEDFDFTAMNEKFKKDEVWGHLGKSSKSHLKEKDGDENGADEDEDQYEEDDEAFKFEIKPVYNKDDFFDSLSSHTLDHDSHNARTRYSVQMKINTETFGDFVRYSGGRGGRGPMRGGRSRGGYRGRGYGYTGRGRGRGMFSHASYD